VITYRSTFTHADGSEEKSAHKLSIAELATSASMQPLLENSDDMDTFTMHFVDHSNFTIKRHRWTGDAQYLREKFERGEL